MKQETSAEEHPDTEDRSEEELREDLYEQFDVPAKGGAMIKWILPLLELVVNTEDRYDIDARSKILAEIALYQAYEREPKFKLFLWAALLIGGYDLLHPLNPDIYSILFLALATINGFASSLRSPPMLAAEVEGVPDENGMPADYRTTALSSANTNVTLVLFVIAVGVQLLLASTIVEGELVARNIAAGVVDPVVSGVLLLLLPVAWRKWIRTPT